MLDQQRGSGDDAMSKRSNRRETWCPGAKGGWAAPPGALSDTGVHTAVALSLADTKYAFRQALFFPDCKVLCNDSHYLEGAICNLCLGEIPST